MPRAPSSTLRPSTGATATCGSPSSCWKAERARLGAACPARLNGELGATYFQAHRLADAQKELTVAYAKATDPVQRALIANDLGNLSASLGRKDDAVRYYQEAQALAGSDAAIAVSAGLNLVRLLPEDQRLSQLTSLSTAVASVSDPRERARFLVNLGQSGARTRKTRRDARLSQPRPGALAGA